MRRAIPVLVVWLSFIGVALLFKEPLGGWSERITAGQKPPYHWRQENVTADSPGSVEESYVGSNGATCATLYHYANVMNAYTVYGFGFSEYNVSRSEAEAEAARWCR